MPPGVIAEGLGGAFAAKVGILLIITSMTTLDKICDIAALPQSLSLAHD
jgi:hypothetical protein